MNQRIYFLFILVLFILSSCGKDQLTPLYRPVTINELRENKPVKFSYHLDDTSIDEYGKDADKIPILGKLFKAIAQNIANSKIEQSGGIAIDPPATVVDLSDVLKVDFNMIDNIALDRLVVSIRNPQKNDNLRFIDKIEIFAKLNNKEGHTRILYYDRGVDKLSCEDKCLALKVENMSWKQIIEENPTIEIKSAIWVNSVPETTMKLAGSVEFSVKFNLGF